MLPNCSSYTETKTLKFLNVLVKVASEIKIEKRETNINWKYAQPYGANLFISKEIN